MQLLHRRVGQFIRIRPSSLLDPSTPIGEVFTKPIGLLLVDAGAHGARFVVYAEERILVLEEELLQKG